MNVVTRARLQGVAGTCFRQPVGSVTLPLTQVSNFAFALPASETKSISYLSPVRAVNPGSCMRRSVSILRRACQLGDRLRLMPVSEAGGACGSIQCYRQQIFSRRNRLEPGFGFRLLLMRMDCAGTAWW